ncbi:MAG: hypothetical protein J7K00_05600 [Candidatus Diapherotrites archaeon]|nr:hypothetical protein [Candidatus Diapherotrites archaeon]
MSEFEENESGAEPNLQVIGFIKKLESQGVEKGEIVRSLLKLGYDHDVVVASFESSSQDFRYADFEKQSLQDGGQKIQGDNKFSSKQVNPMNPLDNMLMVLLLATLGVALVYFLLPFIPIDLIPYFGDPKALPLQASVEWDENILTSMHEAMLEVDYSLGTASMLSAGSAFLHLEREAETFSKMSVPKDVVVKKDFEAGKEKFLDEVSNLGNAISQNNHSNAVFYLKKAAAAKKELLSDFREVFFIDGNLFLAVDPEKFGFEGFPSSLATVKSFVSGQRPLKPVEKDRFFEFPYRDCGSDSLEMLLLVSENNLASVDAVKNTAEFSGDLEVPFEASVLKKSFHLIDAPSKEQGLLALYRDVDYPAVLVINCNRAVFDLSSKQAVKEGVCAAVEDLEFC